MRAVFISFSHPKTPHVSAVRVPGFAHAMAKRGHQVVLLTRTLSDEDPGIDPREIVSVLKTHDWSEPLLVPIKPLPHPVSPGRAPSRLPVLWGRIRTAWSLLRYGGLFVGWSDAARPVQDALVKVFKPQVIWATFLPTDCLVIARRVADAAACPWYLDLKDSWSDRLPRGGRSWLAARFRGAAGVTANSGFHGEQAERWFGKRATTIYDGISEEFLNPPAASGDGVFRVVLVGGTYGRQRLLPFLDGLRSWLRSLPVERRESIVFEYGGSDARAVEDLLRETGALDGLCKTVVHGYLPLEALAKLCASAAVNAYIWLPSGFHHKVLELLACGRPVIAFPGEHAETAALAETLQGHLHVCERIDDLVARLTLLVGGHDVEGAQPRKCPAWPTLTWDARAELLESVLAREVQQSAGALNVENRVEKSLDHIGVGG